MRYLGLRFFLLVALWAGPGFADISPDKIRALLLAGDFKSLQESFASEFETALAAKDFSSLRNVNAILFKTTHPVYQEQAQGWLDAYPSSPYAATALAWGYFHRAFQYRGQASRRETSRESQDAFRGELKRAKAMVELALSNDPNYVPALDASIFLGMTSANSQLAVPTINRALALAPDRGTASLALNALRLKWGGSIAENLRTCSAIMESVPGYDSELCFIEMVFMNDAEGVLRNRALNALEERDEPFLDYARIDAYLNEWSQRPEAFAEAKRIHRDSLKRRVDPAVYLHNLGDITSLFQARLYDIEAKDALKLALEAALVDDPHNVDILDALTKAIFERMYLDDPTVDTEKPYEYWQAMLPYGRYRAEVWYNGVKVRKDAETERGIRRLQMLMGNVAHFGNYGPGWLRWSRDYLFEQYLWLSGELSSDPNALPPKHAEMIDLLICPLFRTARLYDLTCEVWPNAPSCNMQGSTSDYTNRIYRLAKRHPQCGHVLTAPFETLLDEPTSHFVFLEKS